MYMVFLILLKFNLTQLESESESLGGGTGEAVGLAAGSSRIGLVAAK